MDGFDKVGAFSRERGDRDVRSRHCDATAQITRSVTKNMRLRDVKLLIEHVSPRKQITKQPFPEL